MLLDEYEVYQILEKIGIVNVIKRYKNEQFRTELISVFYTVIIPYQIEKKLPKDHTKEDETKLIKSLKDKFLACLILVEGQEFGDKKTRLISNNTDTYMNAITELIMINMFNSKILYKMNKIEPELITLWGRMKEFDSHLFRLLISVVCSNAITTIARNNGKDKSDIDIFDCWQGLALFYDNEYVKQLIPQIKEFFDAYDKKKGDLRMS